MDFKRRMAALDLIVLQTWQSLNFIPNPLRFCVTNKSVQRTQAYKKFLKHLLLAEINNNKNNRKALDK